MEKSDGTANMANHVRFRDIPGARYSNDELGVIHEFGADSLLNALAVVKKGQVYDLDSGRWPGMPLFPAHPPFVMTSYRTAQGLRNQKDLDDWRGENSVNMAFNTELMISSAHTGTHIDALNHITCGPDDHWHGGYPYTSNMGDFGPLNAEASSMPPFLCRGILVDIPKYKGVDILEGQYLVTREDVEGALRAQHTEVKSGDAVIVRTGYMRAWGVDSALAARHHGSGIGHDVALYLAEKGVVLVGGDNESLECNPSPDPKNPHPVHIELLIERGIHILELAHVEDLSRDEVFEFLFVCLPLRIKGATGSMVRPIAVA